MKVSCEWSSGVALIPHTQLTATILICHDLYIMYIYRVYGMHTQGLSARSNGIM